MPVIFQKWIYREDLQKNPSILYLFGDNNIRSGFGGQAKEMRGEPNAIGIRTKWLPNNDSEAFFSDSQLGLVKEMLDSDLERAYLHAYDDGVIVIPLDGLGTGLSRLPELAPEINKYLCEKIENLCKTRRIGAHWRQE